MEYEWFHVLEARLGKRLDQREIEIWDAEIKYEIRDCQPTDILNAVRSLAEDKRKGILKYQVTVNNIISRIIKGRYQDRIGASNDELGTSHDEQMNHWKSDIRLAATTMDKWEIICEPSQVPDCQELEKFAEGLDGGFKRPIFPKLADMISDMGEAWKV